MAYFEDLGCFLYGKAPKKSQFHNARLLGIKSRQAFQRLMDCNEFNLGLNNGLFTGIQRHAKLMSAAFYGLTGPGVIDEDISHQFGGKPEKLGPVLPLNPVLVDESHIGLVNQSCGLKRVVCPLMAKVLYRQAS